jgi:hydrogenase maturation factor
MSSDACSGMKPEVYFLRYAFPCARVLVDFRKTMTENEFDVLREAVENDIPIARAYLEKIFDRAIDGLRTVSEDVWNIDTIREYFWHRHEEHLSKDLPQIVHRLCIVRPGKLVKQIDKDGEIFFSADLGGGDVRAVIPLYKDAAVGDKAMIHYGYAVERLEEDLDNS